MGNDIITVIGSLSSSPFIRSDVKLLQKHCKVYTVDITGRLANSKISRIIQYLTLGLNITFNACPKIMLSDGVLIWFADVHAVLPILLSKLLRKKCVVAIGGFEVSNMPEINYGMMREPIGLRGNICKWVIRNADVCIVPSKSYYTKTLPYVDCSERIYIAPDCIEYDTPLASRYYSKQNIVLMVAQADEGNYLLKGVPYYNIAASHIKTASFYLIGKYDETIKEKYNNIYYLGTMSHDEVLYWMNLSKVYCQLSKTESFGVSIIESMTMGCIPIVTNVDNLPEIIGNNGFVVNDIDEETISKNIQIALSESCFDLHTDISRDAISKSKLFCEKREHALLQIFGVSI
jgi:glycosyltransferase involved in cell wall biosynthesis